MTARKKPSRDDDGGPSFRSVWNWFTGIASVVVGAAFLGVFGWAWSLQNDMTKMIGAVANNADSVRALTQADAGINARIDRLQDVDTAHTAGLATVQAQVGNLQNTQATSAISLSERIRAIEQQNMWRERMQQQPTGRR